MYLKRYTNTILYVKSKILFVEKITINIIKQLFILIKFN